MATAPKLKAIRTAAADDQEKLAELAALVQKIRDDVRSSAASAAATDIPVPDLEPLVRARDAAHAKVDAIGRVNPRGPGLLNGAIQFAKRAIARSLNWMLRDQVAFNHEVVHSLNLTILSLQETNRALQSSLAAAYEETHSAARKLHSDLRRLEDNAVAQHSAMEQRQDQFELSFKSDLATQRNDIQALRVHLASALENAQRHSETRATQNARDFERALAVTSDTMQELVWTEQKKLWDAFNQTRTQYETLIHSELRLARQRATRVESLPAAPAIAAAHTDLHLDWLKFSEKFRGSEAHVRATQQIYVEAFRQHEPIVDLGCGRGEFLDLMRENHVTNVRGIEASPELVAICRSKGLQADCADAFSYLEVTAPNSLGGILCCQMLEHLPPAHVIRLIQLAHRALRVGGILAIETPNPESLAIFATHFYLDPSHTRPIPPALVAFHMEEAGFGALRIERLHPAIESMPSLATLPVEFREQFFGTLDYAAFGTKL